jgi:hypothetical protein
MTSMKKSGKKFNYKRVIVYWNDPKSNPEWVNDIEDEDYCKTCTSIGWLHTKNKKIVKIFSSYNLKDDGSVDDFGDVVTFPPSIIRRIEKI